MRKNRACILFIMKKRIVKTAKAFAAIFAVLAGYYIFVRMTGLSLPCLFKLVTGLECPGCGNTRAFMSLLRLDIKGAFGYNYFIFAEILYFCWAAAYTSVRYIKSGRFYLEIRPVWVNVLFLSVFILWGIVRNII